MSIKWSYDSYYNYDSLLTLLILFAFCFLRLLYSLILFSVVNILATQTFRTYLSLALHVQVGQVHIQKFSLIFHLVFPFLSQLPACSHII